MATSLLSWISEKPQSQLSEWFVLWTLNLFPYLTFQICIFNIHLPPDHYCGILLSILAPPQSMAIKSYGLINKCIHKAVLPVLFCLLFCIHQSHSSLPEHPRFVLSFLGCCTIFPGSMCLGVYILQCLL